MALQEGKFFNIQDVLRDNPPPEAGPKFNYAWLARGVHSTVNVVQGLPPAQPAPDLLHIHREHDEIVYVVEGDSDFRLGEFTKRIKPGDIIFIPAGIVHGPVSGAKMAALSIYAPDFDPENPDREFVS